jgi:ATP-dependent Clp protease ATP-binding subunit ClpB
LYFRPEFINRLDELIVFRPLSVAHIKGIVTIQLENLRKRLEARRITLEITEDAMLNIASKGFDPIYGARPLKRTIQSEIVNPLSRMLLSGELKDQQSVEVSIEAGDFAFTVSD